MSHSANVKILVETLFIKLSRLQDFTDLEKILGEAGRRRKTPAAAGVTPSPPPEKSSSAPAPAPRTPAAPRSAYESPILKNGRKARPSAPASPDTPEKAPDPAAESTAAGKDIPDLEGIREKWEDLIECVKPRKPAIAGLLCQVGLLRVAGGDLYIAAADDYSCNALQRNVQVIRGCLKQVYQCDISLRIEKDKVKDKQRAVKKGDIDPATRDVIQSFDGELL
jgi:hypothetical protein